MTVHDALGNVRFCGQPDNAVLELQGWPEGRIVSYAVLADTMQEKVSRSEQMGDLDAALETWSAACGLSTIPATGPITEADVDITLAYRMGPHGDGQPFDHKGGVVGHAWFPPDGRIHHDNAEDWTISYRQRVTLHEVGHALGLGHTGSMPNVMYPYVTSLTTLGEWDIAEIRGRYGPPAEEPSEPVPPPAPRVPPMMVGVRREEITVDGQPVDTSKMIKLYAADGDSGEDIAESAYFEDGFFVLEIPECRRWSIQMRSPVRTNYDGPFPWEGGRLEWLTNLSFEMPEPETPEDPTGPDDPRWLPWRRAELVALDDGVQIRFLDTRPPE